MKANKFWAVGAVVAVALGYLLVPGCGNKGGSSNNTALAVCQPGQVCLGGLANGASGIPLINSPTMSWLDAQGGSNLVLSFAAPNVTAGQVYNGPVNIAGVFTVAAGACGINSPAGQFQVTGTGTWYSGYGGGIAGVSGQLTVSGGPGGTIYIYPALVRNATVSASQYPYAMSDGYGIAVSGCNRTFAFYN